WRLVTHPGSSTLSPKSPKARVEPRRALPFMRPRWALRYLTRFGINIGSALRPLAGQHLALEDPHLHADHAKGGMGLGQPIIDVRADGVERPPPVAVPLPAGDLRSPKPAGAGDADPVGAQAQGRGDGLLHGAAEGHPLLELEGDVLGHELGVQL